MPVQLQQIAPAEIERESFRIIREEIGEHGFDERTFKVVQRVIHATGDFSFKDSMRLSPGAIEAGIAAIRAGRDILTDVTMVAAGIGKTLLSRWGGRVVCRVAEAEIAAMAKAKGLTRSEAAIAESFGGNIGIIAIGNAPTALVQAIRSVAAAGPNPPLIVGVPVGFVNAAESKALLVEENRCHITSLGRKGGSPVAAAIVNALLRMAAEQP